MRTERRFKAAAGTAPECRMTDRRSAEAEVLESARRWLKAGMGGGCDSSASLVPAVAEAIAAEATEAGNGAGLFGCV